MSMDIMAAFEQAKQKLCAPKGPFLTESQQAAVKTIQNLFWAKYEEPENCPIRGRFHSLLIGPSGSGKTHLVREVARILGLPLFQTNMSDWIVRGAHGDDYTLDGIRDFVRNTDYALIHIDEVDKVRSSFVQSTGWWQTLATETFALLDGKDALRSMDWSENDIKRLSRCLIIGSGAWHETLAENGKFVGFGDSINGTSFKSIAEKAKQIPYEVFARYGDVVEIKPPTREDYAKGFELILRQYGFTNYPKAKLEERVSRALAEGHGARALEMFATKLAMWNAKKKHPGGFPEFTEASSASDEKEFARKWNNARDVQQRFLKRCDTFAQCAIDLSATITRFTELNRCACDDGWLHDKLHDFSEWVIELARPTNEGAFKINEHLTRDAAKELMERIRSDQSKYTDPILADKAAKFYTEGLLWKGDYNLLVHIA